MKKTTLDLLNDVVAMGFNREKALESIDARLDDVFGFENRKEIRDEELSDELYDDILFGFKCEFEENETFNELISDCLEDRNNYLLEHFKNELEDC